MRSINFDRVKLIALALMRIYIGWEMRGCRNNNANGVGKIMFYITLWGFPLERNCYIVRGIPALQLPSISCAA
jgi:hypothetical protein